MSVSPWLNIQRKIKNNQLVKLNIVKLNIICPIYIMIIIVMCNVRLSIPDYDAPREQLPWHIQTVIQGWFWTQHLHVTSWGIFFDITGVVVYTGVGAASGDICCHPHSAGRTGEGSLQSIFANTCPSCKVFI